MITAYDYLENDSLVIKINVSDAEEVISKEWLVVKTTSISENMTPHHLEEGRGSAHIVAG